MQLTTARGFTLIELSVVLVVVALLLSSLLVPLATQVRQRNVAETQKLLDNAREAVIGYAMAKGRLPRPAANASTGVERGTDCPSAVECTGYLPWATLGLPRTDAWGKHLRYSVTPVFASDTPFNFSSISNPKVKVVWGRDKNGVPGKLALDVPAVILSHGARNYGMKEDGTEFPDDTGAGNDDEDANDAKFKCTVEADCNDFWSRVDSSNTSAAGGEFDDLVVWIPVGILYSRMVAAGRLP
jgi:prepilin-type N-terminal cleavage/methylation domain-containing protein